MGKTINTLSSSSHDLLRVPLAHRKADLLASASAMALLAGSSFIALGPMAAMATLGVAGLLFYRLHTPLEAPDTHDTLNQRVLNHFAKKTTTAPLTYGEVGIEDSRHDAIEASLGWVRDNTLTMSQTLRKAMPQAEQNAVLAHEVGHAVYGRMATDFLRAHELVAVAAAVGGVVATTLADQGPTVIQSAALCFNAVAVWGINLAHMRHMERESDRFSVRLTGTANMSNALMYNAKNALQQEPQGVKRTILTLFKDHPYASDRIHLMQQELAKLPEDWKQQRQHELSAIAATAPAYPADDMIPAADKRILQTQEIRTAHPNWATPLRHTAR
jgi:hypothetical protein